MVGIALEGGGAKGSYQAGAYIALTENGIKPDMIAGTSIGAINAALMAQGDINKMIDLWVHIVSSFFAGQWLFIESHMTDKVKVIYINHVLIDFHQFKVNATLQKHFSDFFLFFFLRPPADKIIQRCIFATNIQIGRAHV